MSEQQYRPECAEKSRRGIGGRPAVVVTLGETYGRLRVLARSNREDGSGSFWCCECSCGNRVEVRGRKLTSGHTKSCGCYRRDRTVESNTKLGRRGRQLYNIWSAMISRCHDPKNKSYERYGGRGISVHPRWLHSFESFLADMGFAPQGMSLDRYPNNDGDYEPGNVRWATASQQARNKRTSLLLTHEGKTMCVADWADELGVKAGKIYQRVYAGYSAAEALAEQPRGRR